MGQGTRAQAHCLLLHTVHDLWQSLSWHSYFISVQADCLPVTDSIMTQLFIKMRAVVCPWWTRSWNSFASTWKQIVCCGQTPSWHSLLSAWGQIACPWQTESWHMLALFINTLLSAWGQIACPWQTESWHMPALFINTLLSAWGQIACPWQTESWHMPALFINTATDVSKEYTSSAFWLWGWHLGFNPD